MNPADIAYRMRQFWQTLAAVPEPQDLELAFQVLNPAQIDLFQRLQPSEQAHSLRVYHQLHKTEDGKEHPDLLVAALLHDIGKSRYPLRLWERVLIVLGKVFFGDRAREWGSLEQGNFEANAGGFRRAFIVAEQHPNWGAEMAAGTGASPLAVALIRRHQIQIAGENGSKEDRLLRRLQMVDQSN